MLAPFPKTTDSCLLLREREDALSPLPLKREDALKGY